MITRSDLTIEQGHSAWGGPVIIISLSNRLIHAESWPEDRVRTFELRHTRGLEGMRSQDKGHGWHVDTEGEWHGVLRMRDADDPEAAISEMLDYLNHLAERDRVDGAMASALTDINETLHHFDDSLKFRSHRDHREEWSRFVAAVAAADAIYREVTA